VGCDSEPTTDQLALCWTTVISSCSSELYHILYFGMEKT
jgi:hypothetical protein